MEGICLFINNLNNSDWIALLGVIVSALLSLILIIATYRIGKVQNRLQEKQNKIASMQTYRTLYNCLSEVQEVSYLFPISIDNNIPDILDIYGKDFCQKDLDKINVLINNVKNCKIDMKIQLTKHPKTNNLIMLMLYNMELAYSKIKRLKMPSSPDNLSSENIDVLSAIKKLIKNHCNDYTDCDVNIEKIAKQKYVEVIHRAYPILSKPSWDREKYVNSTYDDKIESINTKLSMLGCNNYIDVQLKIIADCRNQLFEKENGVLNFLEDKCKL